ncbi:hypothetical protein BBI17_006418, partial [Phytophthora kernoviae]
QDFSVVKAYCGHGVGFVMHGAPDIPHYAKNKAVGIMKPGMIFTIEPMINFEHTFLVTETGYEILTARENEPVMKWSQAKVQRPIMA